VAPGVITFLSDYGLADESVGVCHGVIARRCPQARVIDISHAVPRQDVRAGALMLRDALPYMPAGVHLAVVDPGVGTPRRAVALAVGEPERVLVGPDNGLLWPAAERLGGARAAVDIGRSRERLEPVSATFHGRDIFAPVAAALADGANLSDVGEQLDVATLVRLAPTRASVRDGVVHARVARLDGFGNVALDAVRDDLYAAGLRVGETVSVASAGTTRRGLYAGAFADVAAGELVLIVDSAGAVALAVNRGSAAAELDLHPGEPVAVEAVRATG
jgi:S-adenosylmethionine hydrolase